MKKYETLDMEIIEFEDSIDLIDVSTPEADLYEEID